MQSDEIRSRFLKFFEARGHKIIPSSSLIPEENDSSVLLFDEPTKNLDPSIAHRVKDFIKNELIKKEGKVAVWTSHVLSEIAEVADRIAILQKGRFKALGTLNELKKDSHQKDGHLEDIYSFYLTHTRRIE